jgi:hypothetical protein
MRARKNTSLKKRMIPRNGLKLLLPKKKKHRSKSCARKIPIRVRGEKLTFLISHTF